MNKKSVIRRCFYHENNYTEAARALWNQRTCWAANNSVVPVASGLISSRAPHFLPPRFLTDDSTAQQAFYELFSHPATHGYSTFMGLLRSGLVKRSHSMPAMAMPTQSQVKKLKRLMTEKMSWEMAYIMDSRHLTNRRRGERRQSRLVSVQNVLDSRFKVNIQRVWKF